MSKPRQTTLEKDILKLLRSYPDASIPVPLLLESLKMNGKKDEKKLNKALHSLRHNGQIRITRGNLVRLNEPEASSDTLFTGRLDVTRSGEGYVIVEGRDQDIKVPSRFLDTALNGDEVQVRITHYHKRSSKPMGRVESVIHRAKTIFVGTLVSPAKNTWKIEPDEQSARIDFFVDRDDLNGARPGDKVTFTLVQWEDTRGLPQGKILRSLGKGGSNDARILSILAENQFEATFPEEVEKFAESIPDTIPKAEIEKRLDIRDLVTFTIDPVDAKDFDDAISIEELDNGNLRLGVHIADVSHYMPRSTSLDDEAIVRGTSVYLVDRVVPMLPERLSNGVCSLRPREDKLAFSCFMEISPKGKLISSSIRETVINSNERFTYEEAQEVLDGKPHNYKRELTRVAELATVLKKNRFRAGSIQFETPEPRFILDNEGKPVDVIVKERIFTMKMVEECMLMANKTVALHIDDLRESALNRVSREEAERDLYPFIYRVHDKPDLEKLFNIRENVKPLGIEFDVKEGISSSHINKLINEVEGTSMEQIVTGLVLRSMSKAVYSPLNIGHFGLSFSHYSHFTSPIRRYPDVIAHRLLKRYSAGGREYTWQELVKMGEHCSERERYAVQAERDSVKLKQVEFLSGRTGEEFTGVISGVTENGLYVILSDVHCEGMVHVSNLKDDYYIYNAQRHSLSGRSKKREFRLGSEIRVKVVRTDTEKRHIDLTLADS
ncbi:MAG: ribonuclease R [Balneolaceae bacterium]